MNHSRLLPFILFSALALLAAALACNTSNMRARDLPVWTCPTQAPPPTWTMEPGWELLTPPAPTYTPYPSPTPYQLLTDFPLGKHVHIGGVGGIGFGIWVWLDHVEVSGPYRRDNPTTGGTTLDWVARWEVTVENASLTRDYEVYPFAQFYVLEVVEPDGTTHTKGAWGISAEAHEQIGLQPLDISEADNVLGPGEQRVYTVAAYIPAPDVWRLGYVLDPLNTVDIQEMVDKNTLGSNVGVWINTYDNSCEGEITPGLPGADTPTPPGMGLALLLGHPVDSVYVVRGFGCTAFYTGEMDPQCPAGEPWWHNGLDYATGLGSSAYQVISNPASIQWAGDNPNGPDCSDMQGSQPPHNGYGQYVKAAAFAQGHQVEAWWAHLSGFNVSVPSTSNPLAVVGYVGSTGCSTGPHLHFAVRVDGQFVDPLTVMP